VTVRHLLANTVEDLLSLARLHLSDGLLPSGQRYAYPGVLASLREPHAEPRIPDWLDGWGIGLARWDWPGAVAYGWGGVGTGFRAILRFIPTSDAAFVLLTNTSTGRRLYRDLARELILRLGGGPIPPQRLKVASPPKRGLDRFEGIYGVYDHRVTVRSTGDRLIVSGLEGISELLPIEDGIVLADPDGADVRTVAFASDGPDGHPRAVYGLVWALHRIGSE
jgi:hypothetical protein